LFTDQLGGSLDVHRNLMVAEATRDVTLNVILERISQSSAVSRMSRRRLRATICQTLFTRVPLPHRRRIQGPVKMCIRRVGRSSNAG
jgi:hypothetical protein